MRKLWLLAITTVLAAASACSSSHPSAKPSPLASVATSASPSPTCGIFCGAVSARNCGKNATLHCGFQSRVEWLQKYRDGDGIHPAKQLQMEYNSFGVFPQRMRKAVLGVLAPTDNSTKKWLVLAAGQTIDISGAYVGSPNTGRTLVIGDLSMVPIRSSYSYGVKAMVYLLNGQFQWAVVLSDGNPVVLPQSAAD